jgi:hypothetical protein
MKTPKLLLILTAMLLICSLANSQTISELDKKNGFKDFQLGDLYTKWQNNILYEGTLNNGSNIRVYLYTGSCCRQAFNYELDSIELGFLDGKLTVIYLTTKQFQAAGYDTDRGIYTRWNGTKDFDRLKDALKAYFGDYTSVDKGSDYDSDISFFWAGQKAMLQLTYSYLGIDKGDRCKILVGRLDKSMSKSGF